MPSGAPLAATTVRWMVFCVGLSQALLPALRDVSLVFHCASPAPGSDNRALFESVNIQGTRTIIQACIKAGVQVRKPGSDRLGRSYLFFLILRMSDATEVFELVLFIYFTRNWS